MKGSDSVKENRTLFDTIHVKLEGNLTEYFMKIKKKY